MRLLVDDIARLGLFVKREQLLRVGYSRTAVQADLNAGRIIRVRKGWYTLPSAPVAAIQAWRIGGRLTGLSALRTYGIWTPTTRRLHVTVPVDARALRQPTDMRTRLAPQDGIRCRVTWTDRASDRRPPNVWRTSIVDSLVHILNNHDRVTSIICLDAALHAGRETGIGILESDLNEVFGRAPIRTLAWRNEVDGRAEAGGETEFRLAALAAGIPFVPQPIIAGIGRFDGQIGPSTFVEIDGAETHNSPTAFEADRERDLLVASRNGRTLRFSYKLYRTRWEICERAMRNALNDDYRLAKETDFPDFPFRMQPKKPRRGSRLPRVETNPRDFDVDAYHRDRRIG